MVRLDQEELLVADDRLEELQGHRGVLVPAHPAGHQLNGAKQRGSYPVWWNDDRRVRRSTRAGVKRLSNGPPFIEEALIQVGD